MYKHLKSEVKHRGLKRTVEVIKTGCTDRCKAGPIVSVMPLNEWHLHVDEHAADRVLNEALEQVRRRGEA